MIVREVVQDCFVDLAVPEYAIIAARRRIIIVARSKRPERVSPGYLRLVGSRSGGRGG
jgi:hypothetical protein